MSNLTLEDRMWSPKVNTIYNEHHRINPPLELIIDDADKFDVENVLPPGWTIITEEGGSSSLESFLKYWVQYQWAGKGFVDRKKPKYPYDLVRLVFLLQFVLGFSPH